MRHASRPSPANPFWIGSGTGRHVYSVIRVRGSVLAGQAGDEIAGGGKVHSDVLCKLT